MNSIPAAASRRPTLSLPWSPNSVKGRSSGVMRRSRAPSTSLRASSRPVISASSYSGKSHPVILGATNATLRSSPQEPAQHLLHGPARPFETERDPVGKWRSRPGAGGEDERIERDVRPPGAAEPCAPSAATDAARSNGRTSRRTPRRFPAGDGAPPNPTRRAPPPSGAGRRTNRAAKRGSPRLDRRPELAARSAPPDRPRRRRRTRPEMEL